MSESLTKFVSRGLKTQAAKSPAEFRTVTNFDELNERLATYEARLTKLEKDRYQQVWEQRQNEADYDALVKRYENHVKIHDENIRAIERETSDLWAAIGKGEEAGRSYVDAAYKDALKEAHALMDAVEATEKRLTERIKENEGDVSLLDEQVLFLLSRAAPQQLEFYLECCKALRKKRGSDDAKDGAQG